jgi:3-hydroxybutyryl-CoA dehydrogenase
MAQVLPDLDCSESLSLPLEALASEDAQGISNGRGFFAYSPDEAKAWEQLLRRHAWQVKTIVDEERPLEAPK